MKNIFILISSFTFLSLSAQNIQLADITSGIYKPSEIKEMVSSADGEHYFQTDSKNSMIIKFSYKTGAAVDTVFNTKRARECTFDTFEGFVMSPDEKRLIVYNNSERIYRHSFKATYYYYDIRRNHVRNLTENTEKQMSPVFSKDGRMLAFVVNNNIWLAKFDFETESQVTKDGELGKIINGTTDWVYEEEFGVTTLMDFSPDNTLLAFVRFDESAVKEFSFQYNKGKLYPELYAFKYPKAGEKNSDVSCNIFDIQSKTIRKVDIPLTGTEYIPHIEFVTDDNLAVMTMNRDQNEFNLLSANPRSTVSRLILSEKNERYIDNQIYKSFYFFNNQFVYLSEKDGYSHIYLHSTTGVLQKRLTSGNYDVTKIIGVDPLKKALYYQAAEKSPLERGIYKVDLEKGTKTIVTEKSGTNSAQISNGAKYVINTWSDTQNPTLVTVADPNGKQIRVIEDNARLKAKMANIQVGKKEFITVKSKDGQDLNAWILKPVNFNPSKKYPLVMIQYSGPNSQQVLNRFSIDWEYFIAGQDFIVACVDGRGTGARGEEFRKCTYMNLGIKESDDQIAAAKYFASLPYIDSEKIGIWGWSYGGYNVLMSMSRDKIFKAGVAIAPVTDWRFYDSVYTEQFMRTPQQNKLGYDNASPISLAGSLNGNLLIIHGSADDNVHFQNTMEYADALIKNGKQFDLFVFPDLNHSILGASNREYLYQKVTNFFKKNM